MIQVGCAYRTGLLPHLIEHYDLVDVWEHTIDGFVSGAEHGLAAMARFADVTPVTLHSLDLSLGSPAALGRPLHLEEVRAVVEAAGADELSDHLGYSRVDERRLHDFAPLWRVEEQLDLFVRNVDHVQHVLGVPLAIENVAGLFDPGGDIAHHQFANEVVRRTGCRLLLDLSNLLINEANGFLDAAIELAGLDLDAVTSVHLAGGVASDGIVWDAHERPVPAADVDWLARILPRLTNCRAVIIERDGRLQDGAELVDDLRRVRAVVREFEASQPALAGRQ